MAVKAELSIWNHEGNQLEGPRENLSSFVFEFNHDVYLPYDKEQNKIEGSRRIGAFTVVKDIDRLTPQIYDIVCNGRKCTKVQIALYRIATDTGEEEEYFHYILEDANVVAVDNYMPSTKIVANEALGHQEMIKFLAKKFTWSYLDGGIEYMEEAL